MWQAACEAFKRGEPASSFLANLARQPVWAPRTTKLLPPPPSDTPYRSVERVLDDLGAVNDQLKLLLDMNVVLGDYLDWTPNMKFDVIAGNPPYNKPREGKVTGGMTILWDKFVTKSLSLLNDKGILCYVHPSPWRKPESDLWEPMTKLQMCHLHIMSEKEGKDTFGVATKADFYVIQNTPYSKPTSVRTDDGKTSVVDLRALPFLPSKMIAEIRAILTTSETEQCQVVFDTSYHTHGKSWMSETEHGKFTHPVINSIDDNGLSLRYSSLNTKGHFGVSKVILNDARHVTAINDFAGKYGMTQHAFGISISSKREGDLIVAAINSVRFQEIIKATKWSNFQTDYKMFRAFKKDFWKQFVDENGNEIK
jgi:hypothetical protein